MSPPPFSLWLPSLALSPAARKTRERRWGIKLQVRKSSSAKEGDSSWRLPYRLGCSACISATPEQLGSVGDAAKVRGVHVRGVYGALEHLVLTPLFPTTPLIHQSLQGLFTLFLPLGDSISHRFIGDPTASKEDRLCLWRQMRSHHEQLQGDSDGILPWSNWSTAHPH